MKKRMNVMEIMLKIFLVFIVMIVSVSLFAEEQPVDPLSEQVMKLKKKLKLEKTQTAKVREILEKDREQALKDREMFKNSALDLIHTAQERRELANSHIESLLTPEQKEEFKEITKMTPFDRELFALTEGLLLDDDQSFTVEGILIDLQNEFGDMIPEEFRDGERGGEGIGRGRMGHSMRLGSPLGRYGGVRNIMKEREKKKNKAIKKILFKHQKELFEQIKKDRKKKMKETRKKMKDRMKERGEKY